mgnify:CR=1 FL=1
MLSSAAEAREQASEILAGALQDYRRAIVVGTGPTFGKGTVQNLVPLDRWSQRPVNGQLTVTIGKFYRVTGESTQSLSESGSQLSATVVAGPPARSRPREGQLLGVSRVTGSGHHS